jgi:hypothetical protein
MNGNKLNRRVLYPQIRSNRDPCLNNYYNLCYTTLRAVHPMTGH